MKSAETSELFIFLNKDDVYVNFRKIENYFKYLI